MERNIDAKFYSKNITFNDQKNMTSLYKKLIGRKMVDYMPFKKVKVEKIKGIVQYCRTAAVLNMFRSVLQGINST